MHLLRKAASLIACIALCVAVGGIGGYATASEISGWYQGINKPTWNPPNWIFGPVWTTLYVMMGVALWLAWNSSKHRTITLTIFLVQLGLNLLWSFLFFKFHSPAAAFVEIIMLWLAIIATCIHFYRVNKWATMLMIPYLAWVTFAAYLNFTIWRLNP